MELPSYDEFIEPLLRVLAQHPDGVRAPEAHELVAKLARLPEERATLTAAVPMFGSVPAAHAHDPASKSHQHRRE